MLQITPEIKAEIAAIRIANEEFAKKHPGMITALLRLRDARAAALMFGMSYISLREIARDQGIQLKLMKAYMDSRRIPEYIRVVSIKASLALAGDVPMSDTLPRIYTLKRMTRDKLCRPAGTGSAKKPSVKVTVRQPAPSGELSSRQQALILASLLYRPDPEHVAKRLGVHLADVEFIAKSKGVSIPHPSILYLWRMNDLYRQRFPQPEKTQMPRRHPARKSTNAATGGGLDSPSPAI